MCFSRNINNYYYYIQHTKSIAGWYSQKSLAFSMTTSSASVTKLTALFSQSHNRSCYDSRYWHLHFSDCRKTLSYAHATSRTIPKLWNHSGFSNVTCVWSWRLFGPNLATQSIVSCGHWHQVVTTGELYMADVWLTVHRYSVWIRKIN